MGNNEMNRLTARLIILAAAFAFVGVCGANLAFDIWTPAMTTCLAIGFYGGLIAILGMVVGFLIFPIEPAPPVCEETRTEALNGGFLEMRTEASDGSFFMTMRKNGRTITRLYRRDGSLAIHDELHGRWFKRIQYREDASIQSTHECILGKQSLMTDYDNTGSIRKVRNYQGANIYITVNDLSGKVEYKQKWYCHSRSSGPVLCYVEETTPSGVYRRVHFESGVVRKLEVLRADGTIERTETVTTGKLELAEPVAPGHMAPHSLS